MISSPTYTYYIKESTEGEEGYEVPSGATGIVENTYTFTGLKQGTSYDVKVEVNGDVAGNTGTGEIKGQTTASIPSGETGGVITFGNTTWSNNKASVQVSTTTSYQIEYQVNGTEGSWTKIENNGNIGNLNHNDKVYARLTDGNNVGDYATLVVTDDIAPEVEIQAGVPTSNSVQITVTAVDGQSGLADTETYKYYLGEELKATTETNTYNYTGLTQGTRYTLKVIVTDKAGKTTEKTTEITTASISGGEQGQITFGSIQWSNNKASVQVSTETSYTIEYQVNSTSGSWTQIENNGTIENLNYNDTVYARLTDGSNVGDYATLVVTDDIPPEVEIQAGTPTSNSVQITVTASDGQSGLADTGTYQYYLGDDLKQTTETNTYNYTGLTQGTRYTLKVVVTDKAGKTTEKSTETTTASIPGGDEGEPGEEGAITFGNIQWSSNKASVQVSTETGYTIEYQVNETSGSWTQIANNGTIENLNYNETVYARLTDGSNVGDYATLVVTDDIPPEVEIKAGTPTSNSVQLTVTATDEQSGLADTGTYQYYLGTELKQTTETNTYTFAGLTQGTEYTLKVIVTDRAGKTTEKTTDITTASIPGGGTGEPGQGGAIEFGEVRWSNNKASIQVTTNTSYTIEYQIDGTEEGEWQEIASGETIGELQDGNVVNVRLTDGNNVGQMISKTIEDNIAPKVVVAGGGTTSNSVKVVATAEDAESGMISSPTYTYYIKESTEGEEGYEVVSGSTGIGENTYTFTGLKQGTSYDVKVEVNGDVAGNKGTGEIKGQITASIPSGETGGVITFGNTTWSSNKASVQVSTTTSYQIEYQVNNTEEEWTK